MVGTSLTALPNTAAQMQYLGSAFMLNQGAAGLDLDQWAYYWNDVGNVALTGEQVNVALARAGVSSRSQIISLAQFLQAIGVDTTTGAGTPIAPGPVPAPATVPGGAIPAVSGGGGGGGGATPAITSKPAANSGAGFQLPAFLSGFSTNDWLIIGGGAVVILLILM